MAHINEYLNACPGYGWQGGPEFSTQIVELQSGRERRNAMWSQGRHRYAAPFNNISRNAYLEIKKMHMVCRGQLHAFRFKDELDFEADDEVFGFGDGVQTVFQLSKMSTVDGVSYVREVYAPKEIIVVTVNGVPATPEVDYARGLVTFDTPPDVGNTLRWTGDFDVWVRFTQDHLPFTLDNPNATNGSIDLLEVPPPA